ncbi:TonB-dependent receptor [Kangiella aquimarina]|uniref:TonB-dependent receptor n=1 Tax=Kangiella aquimarina TaxID=261965 RepID=A0ABZ0X7Y4_9GAMM|nr:TonB-dependent receptor [Kangiella aquimarina]WQG86463.1 TonB-dependent receptor [Kangiella aquimarina]
MKFHKLYGALILSCSVCVFGSESSTEYLAAECESNCTSPQKEWKQKNSLEDEKIKNVTVIAGSTPSHFTDLNSVSRLVSPTQKTIAPTSILDLLTEVPGVAENGQAGLFQVYSIRGLSRHRVLTYLSDIPLKAERRAGVATSFVHPLLFDYAEVSRGPASTLYQSGSLGGVVKLSPATFDHSFLSVDYQTQGNRNNQIYGTGSNDWSVAVARQFSNNTEDPNGNELNSGYEQYSGSFIKQWRIADVDYEWMLLMSEGNDIGRSSTQYPDRLVTVPNEEHLLSQLSARGDDWRATVYFHPNRLNTLTVRPEQRVNDVTNESRDYGFHYENNWFVNKLEGLWGLDGFKRSGINAFETELSLADNSMTSTQSLNGATERELATFATLNSYWGDTKWQFGTRLLNNRQTNPGFAASEDDAITGFIGFSMSISTNWILTANLGTGVRFATVSERYFVGTTGRGEVIGNPDLETERSVSSDLGVKYSDVDKQFILNIYRQKVSDYIERVEVSPGVLTYNNLNNGLIYGAELDANFDFNEQWELGIGGMWVKGQDDDNQELADIPANRFKMRVRYNGEDWSIDGALQYRFSKDRFSSGERATPAAWVGELAFSKQLGNGLNLSLFVDNFLDEKYYSSSDDIAPLAEGRSFGVKFTKMW